MADIDIWLAPSAVHVGKCTTIIIISSKHEIVVIVNSQKNVFFEIWFFVTMYIQNNYSLKSHYALTGGHLIWLTAWAVFVALLHEFTPLSSFSILWLPISLRGTSVAFYVGFKNNQAYDRLWEGRKIWGGIVNSTRALGGVW